jgi:hypothetical protein
MFSWLFFSLLLGNVIALDPLLALFAEKDIIKQVVEALYSRAQIAPAFSVELLNQIRGVFLIAFIAAQDKLEDFDGQVFISRHWSRPPLRREDRAIHCGRRVADRTDRCGAMTPLQSPFKLSISGPGPDKPPLNPALKTDLHQPCAHSAKVVGQTLVQICCESDVMLAMCELLMEMQKVNDHGLDRSLCDCLH